jgi:hypothetical protein
MLYNVRLNSFYIDAHSRDEAYAKAVRRLRESPETAIGYITDASASKQKPSLLRRLVTGE